MARLRPANIECPHIEVDLVTSSGTPVYLSAAQARAVAAALVRSTDAADIEAHHRPPVMSGVDSTDVPGTVALGQA